VGRAVADQVVSRPTPALAGLSPDRISQFAPAQVAAFIAAPSEGQERA
jgi:hypothetical protein